MTSLDAYDVLARLINKSTAGGVFWGPVGLKNTPV